MKYVDRENNIVVPSVVLGYVFYSPVKDEDMYMTECVGCNKFDLLPNLYNTLIKLKGGDNELSYKISGEIVTINDNINKGYFMLGDKELSIENQVDSISFGLLCDLIYWDIMCYSQEYANKIQ